jgi:hypothetical protein
MMMSLSHYYEHAEIIDEYEERIHNIRIRVREMY